MDRTQLFLCERRLGFTDDGQWQVRVSALPETWGGLCSGPVSRPEMLGQAAPDKMGRLVVNFQASPFKSPRVLPSPPANPSTLL